MSGIGMLTTEELKAELKRRKKPKRKKWADSYAIPCVWCGARIGEKCKEDWKTHPISPELQKSIDEIKVLMAQAHMVGRSIPLPFCRVREGQGRVLSLHPEYLQVHCPSCGVQKGEFCKTIKAFSEYTQPPMDCHPRRVKLAKLGS